MSPETATGDASPGPMPSTADAAHGIRETARLMRLMSRGLKLSFWVLVFAAVLKACGTSTGAAQLGGIMAWIVMGGALIGVSAPALWLRRSADAFAAAADAEGGDAQSLAKGVENLSDYLMAKALLVTLAFIALCGVALVIWAVV